MTKAILALFVPAVLVGAHQTAFAQAWPAKPIRLVLAVGPGSGVETSARVVNAKLNEALGQPLVIDFHPGASGQIGADLVARSAPDGYTLLYTVNAPISSLPATSRNVPYDPVADFTPITAMIKSDTLFVANPKLPAANLRELIEYARRSPGKVTYGTNGIGGSYHLLGLQLARIAGIDLLHVPYKSGGPALVATQSGEIDTLVSASGSAVPFLRSGKLKALVVFDDERAGKLPDVPAITEIMPGFTPITSWVGFLGPAKLPREIVERLHQAVLRAIKDPEVRAKLEATGQTVTGVGPEPFALQIRRQLEITRTLVREAGIKPE